MYPAAAARPWRDSSHAGAAALALGERLHEIDDLVGRVRLQGLPFSCWRETVRSVQRLCTRVVVNDAKPCGTCVLLSAQRKDGIEKNLSDAFASPLGPDPHGVHVDHIENHPARDEPVPERAILGDECHTFRHPERLACRITRRLELIRAPVCARALGERLQSKRVQPTQLRVSNPADCQRHRFSFPRMHDRAQGFACRTAPDRPVWSGYWGPEISGNCMFMQRHACGPRSIRRDYSTRRASAGRMRVAACAGPAASALAIAIATAATANTASNAAGGT